MSTTPNRQPPTKRDTSYYPQHDTDATDRRSLAGYPPRPGTRRPVRGEW